MVADNDRLGYISLGISIVGMVLPLNLGMIFVVLLKLNILREQATYAGLCLLLGGVLELAALGCGLGARRTTAGKTALVLSLASLLFMFPLFRLMLR